MYTLYSQKEKTMKRILAFTLAFLLLLPNFALASGFSFSIDSPLVDGLTFVESTTFLDDGKDSHTYTFEYIPGKSAFPVVAWGESQKSRETLLKISELYGDKVVGGINADFFSFYTGISLGCVVSEGRFLSSSVNNNALAVLDDGSLYIGTPDIKSTLTYGESTYDFYYNKYPQIYSLYIMDSTYYESTASTFPSLEIVLAPESDSLYVNTVTPCTVTAVAFDTMDSPIPEGSFVLTAPNGHSAYDVLQNVQIGDTLSIDVTGSSPWDTARYVIGGGDIIVKDSQFVSETVDEYSDKVRNARTAVGIREDGSAVFFAVNGKRANYSSGMTLEELANTLISMGAVTVLNLDGGGSTTVGVKHLGEDEMQLVNYPTDGYPRGISNAILFVNTAETDGKATSVILFPNFYFALPEALIEIEEAFFDSSMTPVEELITFNEELFALTDGIQFTDGKLYVSNIPLNERVVGVNYTLEDGRVLTDTKTFYVPDKLDLLLPKAEKQVLDLGESTKIEVNAQYNGFDVTNSLKSFSWSFSENNAEALDEGVLAENDVARLYEDGTLTVVTDKLFSSTTLMASYGDTFGAVDIYAGMPDVVLDDFEPDDLSVEATDDVDVAEETEEPTEADVLKESTLIEPDETMETVTEVEEVQKISESVAGYKSNTGALLENGSMTYDTPIEVTLRPNTVTLMHKGKYTTEASLVIINSDGEEIAIPYTVKKDYSEITDWTELEAVIPETVEGRMYVKSPFTSSSENSVVIDNLIATYGFVLPVFDDLEGSWAKDYITEIYHMGLIGGYIEDGKTVFAPNRQITRAEFAKLVSSYQKYTYSNTQLNFNDSDEIPEWAVSYVGAVSENNVMNGRAEGDGTLTFAPNDSITRTEAMLVLSRILPDIIDTTDLTFSDASDVPDWAIDGVKKVVSGGIITGYDDNTIRPSNNLTRAEVAVIFSRLFTYMYTTDSETDFPLSYVDGNTELEEQHEDNKELPVIPF